MMKTKVAPFYLGHGVLVDTWPSRLIIVSCCTSCRHRRLMGQVDGNWHWRQNEIKKCSGCHTISVGFLQMFCQQNSVAWYH